MTTHAREALAAAARRLAPVLPVAVNRLEVSDRELHTILAALRNWHLQGAAEYLLNCPKLLDIVTNGETCEPLTRDEIDGLCERINEGG